MTLVFGEHESDQMIMEFKGDNDFLSNFYPAVVHFEGINFPTVEHAYVASKSKDGMHRYRVSQLPAEQAGKAKRLGRKCRLREDWDLVKVSLMKRFLMQKFGYADLRDKLLATGDKIIVEGNYWHDNFWGTCGCGKGNCAYHGKNMLGKLLMEVREIIK